MLRKMQFIKLTLCCLLATSTLLSAADEETANSDTQVSEAPTEQTAATRVQPDANADIAKDLAEMFKDSFTEVVQLSALDKPFDSYYVQADEAEPIGSLLFFPDDRNHSDWPVTLHPLRTELARYKWQTLVITQPATTPPPLPARSEDSGTTPESETQDATAAQDTAATDAQTPPADEAAPQALTATSEETPQVQADKEKEGATPLSDTIQARAEAAAEMLKEQSDLIVIIGIGRGATWASTYAATIAQSEAENTKLILINPQQSDDVSAPSLTEMLGQSKLTTIDIYSENDSFAARERKRAANHAEVEEYTQIKAPQFAWHKQGNQWLTKKVRGILKVKVEQPLQEKEEKKKKRMAAPLEKPNQRPGQTTEVDLPQETSA